MKKAVKIILICILVIMLLAIGGYLLMANYYAGGFAYGTYINGVYCTGKTAEQVNAELSLTSEQMPIKVFIGDRTFVIMPDDIDYRYDYYEPLVVFLNNQNPYLWGQNISKPINHEVQPVTTYNQELVRTVVDSWKLSKIDGPHFVRMYLSEEDGYILKNSKTNEIDSDKVSQIIIDALAGSNFADISEADGTIFHTLSIDKENVLKEPEYSKEEQDMLDLYERVNELQNKNISFGLNNGSKRKFTKTEIIGLIKTDYWDLPELAANGDIIIDQTTVESGLMKVLEPYDTYQNHYFKNHNGEIVHITKGTYGSEIDIESHIEPLCEALNNGEDSYVADLVYKRESPLRGKDDIGDTYLEISIDEQHLYYFVDGKVVLDSDVVTGNHSHGSDTPKGVFDVFYMQRNRTLVGATYRSFVKYWINFAHHIGVHDASWRDEYGGQIYLTSGSHGCVNTPEEKVSKLYEMIEIGTPVIVY